MPPGIEAKVLSLVVGPGVEAIRAVAFPVKTGSVNPVFYAGMNF